MMNFALAGNPNCGKTTLFNSLTGSTAHVGNWPGVTVDKRDGTCKLGREDVNIIDLPGIYSLSPYTPEEVISRQYIIDVKPDCVINIVDTTNLERNLYLTTQIMEMDVPVVVALNMMDVLEKNGEQIDIKVLEEQLGVPVVMISALKEKNLKELINAAISASEKKRSGFTVLSESPISHLITDLTIAFQGTDITNPLFHAVKLAELDEVEVKDHPHLIHVVEGFKKENMDPKFQGDYEALIADSRYKYITTHYSPCIIKAPDEQASKKEKKSYRIDKVLTNRWAGIPIFIFVLFLIFHLTFSENFLFFGGLINSDSFASLAENQYWSGLSGLFWTSGGINSPGVILANLFNALTGAFTEVVRTWLTAAPGWVSGLICDGVLGGLFAVLGFLPQILVLFLLFSILEDSGYMARIAFIIDRIFRKFGLSGRAFLPMIMGFGCSVPAMINTRTIADEQERIATVRVIPFFSCGAKLPILTAISGCIAASFGFANVDLITLAMYLLGMVTAVVTVLIMRQTTMRGHTSPFIMELPDYHMPQFKSTMMLLWDKCKHFVKKAFTIILASTIIIWFLSHFQANGATWTYLADDADLADSILGTLGRIVQPLFDVVGFGIGTYGWVFVVAIISGLIAKENAIGVLGTLAASVLSLASISVPGGADSIEVFIQNLSDSASPIYDAYFAAHGTAMLLSFIAFNMLTIPCFAAVATARGELPKGKFATTILMWLAVSFLVSSAIFLIPTYWWTLFIYVGLAGIAWLTIYLVNKKRDAKANTLKGA